jgi:hypothetical protein
MKKKKKKRRRKRKKKRRKRKKKKQGKKKKTGVGCGRIGGRDRSVGRNFGIVMMTRKRKVSCTNRQSGAVTIKTIPQRSNSLCLFHCCTQL